MRAGARRVRLGDHGKAVELLHGLEQELPLLAREVARYRAEAAFVAGPFLVAAAYFERSGSAPGLARAALATMKGGDLKQARALADRAVAAAQRARRSRDEAAARMARARVLLGVRDAAERPGEKAAAAALAHADLRWIVKSAPSSPDGREAAALLAALPGQLSQEERLQKVDAMVAGGSAAEAIAELDKMSGVPASELHHRRATALYQARDYEAAAAAFLKVAASPSARQAEQLHLAARSLSRLRREAEAIERHLAVARRFRKTRWGARACSPRGSSCRSGATRGRRAVRPVPRGLSAERSARRRGLRAGARDAVDGRRRARAAAAGAARAGREAGRRGAAARARRARGAARRRP